MEQNAGINTPLVVDLVDIGAVTAQLIGQPDRGSALPFQFRLDAHPDVEWFLVAVHVMILDFCSKFITIYKKSVSSSFTRPTLRGSGIAQSVRTSNAEAHAVCIYTKAIAASQ